jgi:hypothetical protein
MDGGSSSSSSSKDGEGRGFRPCRLNVGFLADEGLSKTCEAEDSLGAVDGRDGRACVGIEAFVRGGIEGRGDVVLGRGRAAIGEAAVVRGGAVTGEAAVAGGGAAIGGGCTIWSTSISGATPEGARVSRSVTIASSESCCIGTLREEVGAGIFFLSVTFVLGPDSLADRLECSASSSSLSSMTMISGVPFLTFGRDFCPSPVFFLGRGTILDGPTLLLGLEGLDVALSLEREDGSESESEEISMTSFGAIGLNALLQFSMLDKTRCTWRLTFGSGSLSFGHIRFA